MWKPYASIRWEKDASHDAIPARYGQRRQSLLPRCFCHTQSHVDCLAAMLALLGGHVYWFAQTYKTYRSKVEKGERKTDVVEMATLCQLYGTTASELLKGIGIE